MEPTFTVGDAVHYWNRRSPTSLDYPGSVCHRATIIELSPEGKWARVRRLFPVSAVPVQLVLTKRLRRGWNNWRDTEGRLYAHDE